MSKKIIANFYLIMPIDNFFDNTFVAFCDISGFKVMMKNAKAAEKALDFFYSISYETLIETQNLVNKVEGLFVSDSGILFIRSNTSDKLEHLNSLLKTVQIINKRLLEQDLMLTTSISYGALNYQGKLEFSGIEKNSIYGNAYLNAFLDNERGTPRIQPGQCRIIKSNLPDEIDEISLQNKEPRIKSTNKHYYFFWMVDAVEEIEGFESKYLDSYQLKYAGMLKALKSNLV